MATAAAETSDHEGVQSVAEQIDDQGRRDEPTGAQ
jgi:hypothetical protein